MTRYGVLRPKVINWQTGEVEFLAVDRRRLLEWVLYYMPVPATIVLFLVMAFFLLCAFLGYQLFLISKVRARSVFGRLKVGGTARGEVRERSEGG